MKISLTIIIYILSFNVNAKKLETATFAGGCFWCVEANFEKLDGVVDAISGFSGGLKPNPTYENVSGAKTKHLEVISVIFDPRKVSYNELLEEFWKSIDPTDSGGQFVDRGYQYTTAIFYHDDIQKNLAEKSKQKVIKSERFSKRIVTPIRKFNTFYKANDYHQNFYKKNSKSIKRYKSYRKHSGRDQFRTKYWSEKKSSFIKPSKKELRKSLTKLQFEVTQEDATERPFKNMYWDNNKEGIYVDIVSLEPLFSSKDKFKSGTGWPSFTRALINENIVEKEDRSLFSTRIELRSKNADSHLGHVFNDGPKPTGLRYCINSASLKFIPKSKLQANGLGHFLKHFEK